MTMTRAQRRRERTSAWPVWLYWLVRRLSPLIMLAAIASSGWLLTRTILVWGVGGDEYSYGADIPAALAVVVTCGLVVLALRRPPAAAIAQVSPPDVRRRTVVAGLGDQWRWSFQLAALPGGLLAVFAPFAIPTALGWNPGVPANLWFGLPVSILITAMSAAMITAVARSALHGVELTPTHLIARGYFWTRRFERSQITEVRIVGVRGWAATLFAIARMGVSSTLRITLSDGSRHVLNASNSRWRDMDRGVDVIRAWGTALDSAGS